MIMNHSQGLSWLKKQIDTLLKKQSPVVIGIDGMAASGKTTLANTLKKQYKALVIHMDDFFLQDHQKTDERLLEVDGFVDYERLTQEVINPLKKQDAFIYHRYNCQTKTMSELYVNNDYDIYIIEGAYALRESFIDLYDVKVLMLIDDIKQLSRIKDRNPSHLLEQFKEEWIPRENKYIQTYHLKEKTDVVILSE